MQINELAVESNDVPQIVETTTPETTVQSSEENKVPETPRHDNSVPISRFNKVYAKSKEHERENVLLREQIAKHGQQNVEAPPDISQYTEQSKYLEDLAKHTGKQAAREEFASLQQAEKSRVQQTEIRDREATATEHYRKQLAEANKKYPGLSDALMASPIIADLSPEASLIVAESKLAGELTHFLLDNPEEAAEIVSMPPQAAIFAIRRIEKELSKSGNLIPEPKVSKMSAPISPIGASKNTSRARTSDESIEEMAARMFPLG